MAVLSLVSSFYFEFLDSKLLRFFILHKGKECSRVHASRLNGN